MISAAKAPTNVSNIGVVMFTVADQDAALAFYTEKLGYEMRGDTHFGENGEMRWLEVGRRDRGRGWRSIRPWAASPVAAQSVSARPTSWASMRA